jgi:HEAT repeat protein
MPETPAASSLSSALSNEARPLGVRRQLLRLIADQRLGTLRPAVAGLTAERQLRGDALAAITALDGGLPSEQVLQLLSSKDEDLRAAGVRASTGTLVEDRLPSLVRSDPSPMVRIAAVEILVTRRGVAALPLTLAALGDRDLQVRRATAVSLAKLGEEAAKAVEAFAMAGTFEQAQGAILALDYLGPQGTDGLRHLATSHADSRVRVLADLALGKMPPEH